MPRVEFEPTISAFEREKTVHAFDRAATVTVNVRREFTIAPAKMKLMNWAAKYHYWYLIKNYKVTKVCKI
jgi:hypothetical protein